MELNQTQKKQYRSIGHKLNPVVIISDKGLTDGVNNEINRALADHELIKIKLAAGDPAARKQLAEAICEDHGATLVQSIGKVILILKPAKKPNPKLSNILRNQFE